MTDLILNNLNNQLAECWKAATHPKVWFIKRHKRENILNINIVNRSALIMKHIQNKSIKLYIASTLTYGVVKIRSYQVEIIYNECEQLSMVLENMPLAKKKQIQDKKIKKIDLEEIDKDITLDLEKAFQDQECNINLEHITMQDSYPLPRYNSKDNLFGDEAIIENAINFSMDWNQDINKTTKSNTLEFSDITLPQVSIPPLSIINSAITQETINDDFEFQSPEDTTLPSISKAKNNKLKSIEEDVYEIRTPEQRKPQRKRNIVSINDNVIPVKRKHLTTPISPTVSHDVENMEIIESTDKIDDTLQPVEQSTNLNNTKIIKPKHKKDIFTKVKVFQKKRRTQKINVINILPNETLLLPDEPFLPVKFYGLEGDIDFLFDTLKGADGLYNRISSKYTSTIDANKMYYLEMSRILKTSDSQIRQSVNVSNQNHTEFTANLENDTNLYETAVTEPSGFRKSNVIEDIDQNIINPNDNMHLEEVTEPKSINQTNLQPIVDDIENIPYYNDHTNDTRISGEAEEKIQSHVELIKSTKVVKSALTPDALLEQIKLHLLQKNMITFQDLFLDVEISKAERNLQFKNLTFLAHDRKIKVNQEEPYGLIEIRKVNTTI